MAGHNKSHNGEPDPSKESKQETALVKVNEIQFKPDLDSGQGDVIQDLAATLTKNHNSRGKRCFSIDK